MLPRGEKFATVFSHAYGVYSIIEQERKEKLENKAIFAKNGGYELSCQRSGAI